MQRPQKSGRGQILCHGTAFSGTADWLLCAQQSRGFCTLTTVVAKCFEKTVLKHKKDCLPPSFDPHQFAYKANRSTEGAISSALHCTLCHLENPGTSVRMLFIDFSSAFSTIIPILITRLDDLALPSTTQVSGSKTSSPTAHRPSRLGTELHPP